MAADVVAAVGARLRELRALVGPGWPPGADPVPGLRGVRDALAAASAAARSGWRQTAGRWSGAGADGAAGFVAATAAALDGLADDTDRLAAAADAAGAAVARAHRRLGGIIERFEARAAALAPFLNSPQGLAALTAEAEQAVAEAVAVIAALRADLDDQTRLVRAATVPPEPMPVPPEPVSAPPVRAGAPAAATRPAGQPVAGWGGFGGATAPVSAAPAGVVPASGWATTLSDLTGLTWPEPATEAAAAGSGLAVPLPDGSVVVAPNRIAADAVRHALTQLGVPYRWGGTTPGVGLDCSGLTQWAYRQAGLEIPRLAQEQDVGVPVAPGDLRPGDLAVWDGHVAMIVGNGQMIEAGDPVQLSPIRTTNAGQGFQGFWRPTG